MPKKITLGKRKDEGLEVIQNMVIDMFTQLETMIELSKILLETNNREIAVQIVDEDKNMDDMMSDLTIEISNFITREQPLAQDLRMSVGNLRIISDLERMGDYFKNFAKFTLKVEVNSKTQYQILTELINQIFDRVVELRKIYLEINHKEAKSLAKRDEEIDILARDLIANVNEKLRKENDLDEIKSLTRVVMIARTFERSGDHIVNICENISYINKGQIYHYA